MKRRETPLCDVSGTSTAVDSTYCESKQYRLQSQITSLSHIVAPLSFSRLDSDPRWSKVYDPFPQATS